MMVSKAMGLPFNMPMYGYKKSLVQLESDPVCHSAGCTQYTWMDALRKKKEGPPVFYDTDQKLDSDVIGTWDNLDVAEKIKNHEWKFNHEVYDNRDKLNEPTEYNLKPDLDEDIVNTQGHLAASEKKLGDWDIFEKKPAKK
jgi:hypothetical protein